MRGLEGGLLLNFYCSRHVDFVAKFARMVIQLGAENVFALSVKVLEQGLLTEFELPNFGSMILVREAPMWLTQNAQGG